MITGLRTKKKSKSEKRHPTDLKESDEEIKKAWMRKPYPIFTLRSQPETTQSFASEIQTQESLDSFDLEDIRAMDDQFPIDLTACMEIEDDESESLSEMKKRGDAAGRFKARFIELKNVNYDKVSDFVANSFWESPKYQGNAVVIAVDPGPVNCGIAIADAKTMEVLAFDKRSFRESKGFTKGDDWKDTSISCTQVIKYWIEYVKAIDGPGVTWIIEDQVAGYIKGTNSREQDAIVFSLCGAIEEHRRYAMSPSAVEKYFRGQFPDLPRMHGESQDDYAPRKRKHKKKCAVDFAKKLLSHDFRLLDEFKKVHNSNPDIADAIVLIKYFRDNQKGLLSFAQQRRKFGTGNFQGVLD